MLKARISAAVAILALGIVSSGMAFAEGAKEGEMCGGIAGIKCGDALWCDPSPGHCNGADIAGQCIKVPEVCTQQFDPVCGCDGKTYGNDCMRQASKVALDHKGECGAAKKE